MTRFYKWIGNDPGEVYRVFRRTSTTVEAYRDGKWTDAFEFLERVSEDPSFVEISEGEAALLTTRERGTATR